MLPNAWAIAMPVVMYSNYYTSCNNQVRLHAVILHCPHSYAIFSFQFQCHSLSFKFQAMILFFYEYIVSAFKFHIITTPNNKINPIA